ncbi:MAG: transglycosylase SLT domain-containing protein [Archangiaceae bacterium]|nr:transglycosylase SLT domain-containing protein [Archangiaceae bacterium]
MHRTGASALAQRELQACVEVKCGDADRLSLLLGYLLLSDSQAREAAAQLDARPPPRGLEAFHGWYLGEALSWSGERDQALKVLARARKAAPPWLQTRIDARLGELWLGKGDAKKGLPLLEAASASDPSAELLYQRGLSRWMTGDATRGQADLKAVAVRFPLHPYAARAEELVKPAYSFDEHLFRATVLGGQRAVDELEPLTPPPGKEGRLELALAAAYFQKGDDAKGQEQLDHAAARGPGVASEALMARARRFMKKNDNPKARETMLKLDALYPEQPTADDAAYLAAWIAMQAGEFDQAADDFGRFDARHPTSKKRDEARWFKAYSEYRAGHCSVATLQSLIDDFPRSSLVPQARYWMARCQQQGPTGPVDGGVKAAVPPARLAQAYQGIISAYPQSFYALLSSERLRELGVEPSPPFTTAPRSLAVPVPNELKLARLLSAAGLFKDAGTEVDRALSSVRSADQALKLGHALQGIGEYGPAYTLAARWLWGSAFTQKQPEAIALLYPRAFAESVEKFSQDNGLDPYLAWAIMRQESAFRPEVTSSADARGLMQLIPPTAASIAKTRRVDAVDPAELYAPEQSISMGTWLLSALLERFGHPSLMAAAYNAGAAPVAEWARHRNTLPLDEWVEAIPWKETRGYAKNVTANYFVYRTLYAPREEAWRLSLKVPEPKTAGVNF